MKGKIDKHGNLWIERAGVLKEAYCRDILYPDGQSVNCGDSCSKFGEPFVTSPDAVKFDGIGVELCKTILHFKELIDERNTGA